MGHEMTTIDEVVQVVAEEELQDRPRPVAEQRVPAADHEVQDLLPAADDQPRSRPEQRARRSAARRRIVLGAIAGGGRVHGPILDGP